MFFVGIILSIVRIFFIMFVNEIFGIMFVLFRRIFGDLVKLLVMFVLILFSFLCGFVVFYVVYVC